MAPVLAFTRLSSTVPGPRLTATGSGAPLSSDAPLAALEGVEILPFPPPAYMDQTAEGNSPTPTPTPTPVTPSSTPTEEETEESPAPGGGGGNGGGNNGNGNGNGNGGGGGEPSPSETTSSEPLDGSG